jgi:hypothetical protein
MERISRLALSNSLANMVSREFSSNEFANILKKNKAPRNAIDHKHPVKRRNKFFLLQLVIASKERPEGLGL